MSPPDPERIAAVVRPIVERRRAELDELERRFLSGEASNVEAINRYQAIMDDGAKEIVCAMMREIIRACVIEPMIKEHFPHLQRH